MLQYGLDILIFKQTLVDQVNFDKEVMSDKIRQEGFEGLGGMRRLDARIGRCGRGSTGTSTEGSGGRGKWKGWNRSREELIEREEAIGHTDEGL